MANNFSVTQYVSNETIVRFANELQFIKTANRNFEKDYKDFPVAIGTTLNYRLEENYVVNKGRVAAVTDRVQLTRPLTITEQDNITLNYNSFELTYDRAKDKPYLDMAMSPIMRNLANSAESFVGRQLKFASYNVIGTPGSPVSTPAAVNNARAKMVRLGIPDGDNYLAMNTQDMAALANGVNNYFNTSLNTAALRRGYVGSLAEFDMFETIFLNRHTSGTGVNGTIVSGLIGAGTVQAVPASGSNTIVLQGFTAAQAGTFRMGDIIQIANVNSVNPITRTTTGDLATFVVTADAAVASGAGYVTLSVSPAFNGPASPTYQNIDALPQVNAQVSLYASHNVNVAYHKNAIVFAAPPMALLKGGVESTRSYSDMYKISMRYAQGADILNDLQLDRVDINYGVAINGEYCVRIVS